MNGFFPKRVFGDMIKFPVEITCQMVEQTSDSVRSPLVLEFYFDCLLTSSCTAPRDSFEIQSPMMAKLDTGLFFLLAFLILKLQS